MSSLPFNEKVFFLHTSLPFNKKREIISSIEGTLATGQYIFFGRVGGDTGVNLRRWWSFLSLGVKFWFGVCDVGRVLQDFPQERTHSPSLDEFIVSDLFLVSETSYMRGD